MHGCLIEFIIQLFKENIYLKLKKHHMLSTTMTHSVAIQTATPLWSGVKFPAKRTGCYTVTNPTFNIPLIRST